MPFLLVFCFRLFGMNTFPCCLPSFRVVKPPWSRAPGWKFAGINNSIVSAPQEEEKKKAKEAEEQREHEEYLKLKESFVVEEEGVDEAMTEEEVGWVQKLLSVRGLGQDQGLELQRAEEGGVISSSCSSPPLSRVHSTLFVGRQGANPWFT